MDIMREVERGILPRARDPHLDERCCRQAKYIYNLPGGKEARCEDHRLGDQPCEILEVVKKKYSAT